MGVSIASCGVVTKKYQGPELGKEVSDHLVRDTTVTDSTSFADLSWKEVFADANLQGLIEQGLKNNFDYQNAILNIAQAEASFRQSKMAFLPNFNLAPQITHSKTSSQALNFPAGININLKTTTVQLGVSSNWELDVWGKLASAKRGAFANWLSLGSSKRAVETALISNIALNYYTLIALDTQLKVTEETIALRQQTVKALRLLNEAGNVTGADVVQAEASLYNAQVSIPDIKRQIRERENALCLLLGKPAQSIARASFNRDAMDFNFKLGIPYERLSSRPDVEAAELKFRQAFEQTNVARAMYYPSFTITSASAGISALTTRDLFSESLFYNIVGGLTQPILAKGSIRANHKIAIAQQEQALNNYHKAIIQAGMEVSNALFSYEMANEKEVSRKLQVESLEKAVHFNMRLLEFSSNVTYTDVLTSEQNLITAKLSEINDQLQKQSAIIELYRALGGGWK